MLIFYFANHDLFHLKLCRLSSYDMNICMWFRILNWTIFDGVIAHADQGWQKDGKYSYFPGRWEILVIPGKYW